MREVERTCNYCKVEKPLSEFHKNKGRKLGHEYRCKPCMAIKDRAYRITNREKVTILHKKYLNTEKGKALTRKWMQTQFEKNPQQILAVRMVNKAVQKGELIKQPCEYCGSTKRIEGHHEDYSKPLEVRWLCHIHHKYVHGRIVDLSILPTRHDTHNTE